MPRSLYCLGKGIVWLRATNADKVQVDKVGSARRHEKVQRDYLVPDLVLELLETGVAFRNELCPFVVLSNGARARIPLRCHIESEQTIKERGE